MSRVMSKMVLTVAVVSVTAVGSLAQQQATSSETKTFEVLALSGNNLVVRLPEGTRELTVPDDFRFTVDGQSMSVQQLQVGMKGTATITTRTTVTPVTVTEVKNGTVLQAAAGTIVVNTGGEVKRFSQGDVDKRGVRIMRSGKPAQITDFRVGDQLTATIITSRPPQITTEREVQASLARAAAPPPAAPAPQPAAAAPAPPPQVQAPDSAPAPSTVARTLPKTASSLPLVGLTSVLLLAVGLFLTSMRRLVD
jgi:hypothetical protein